MKLLSLIVLLVLTVILDQSAFACECYSKLEKEEALLKSEVAVLAKVMSVDLASVKISSSRPNGLERSIPANKYTLEAIEQFKGNSQSSLEALSRKTSCFVDLEPGREYIFYLRAGTNGNLSEIDSCDRVLPVENGSDDLEYLRHQ